MTRYASSDNETEGGKAAVTVRLLAALDFASGVVYVNDGTTNVEHSSNTYLGIGTFGGIEAIQEDDKVTPATVKLTLAGIPNELIGSAMTETYQGRAVTLYWGFLHESTGAWIDTPETLWAGVMDVMSVNLGPRESVVELICDDPDYCQPYVRRYTREDHQLDYSGDKFFEYVPNIPGFRSQWGSKGYGSGVIVPPTTTFPFPFGGGFRLP